MKLPVVNIKGDDTGRKVDLPKEIFGIEPNDHALYLSVRQYLAAQRRGTHKAKERNEIRGSRKKLRKQKGSGAARVGDIKSPIFRGGGRVFGPKPRDYNFKLNKKLKALAGKSALTYKAKDKQITVLEDFSFDTPKTKEYLAMLVSLSVSENKTLLVLSETNKNIRLSGRNLEKAKIVTASDLNTYDVLNAEKLLLSEQSLAKISERFN